MPNAPDPLQDLRDVHMPDPISWWPPAFGWWMIMGLLIIGGSLIIWVWAYRQRTRPRRLALAQLKDVKQQYAAHVDDHWAITQLSHLVRRVALAAFPRSHVAGLSGQDLATIFGYNRSHEPIFRWTRAGVALWPVSITRAPCCLGPHSLD